MNRSLFAFDAGFRGEYAVIAGIDEAGRGPLAGPLVASAVVLPPGIDIPGVHDSKTLTDRRRRVLFEEIKQIAISIGLGIVTVDEIDGSGMVEAVRLSFVRAAEALDIQPDIFLVDGNPVKGLDIPCRFLVKGDGRSLSIAAASIVAKVSRDDMMLKAHELYPEYGFDSHKGYGTAAHRKAIDEHGPCSIHRMSFAPLKESDQPKQLVLPLIPEPELKPVWKQAEDYVARQLESNGWKIEARNWSWKGGEVDIIATKADTTAFVEVKHSSSGVSAKPFEKLDRRKTARIASAAAYWIGITGSSRGCRFDVAVIRGEPGGFSMNYLENAFTAEDLYSI